MEKMEVNSTERFKETVSDNLTLDVTKTTRSGKTSVYGKLLDQDGDQTGHVNYDEKTDKLFMSIDGYSTLSDDEKTAVVETLGKCVKELTEQ